MRVVLFLVVIVAVVLSSASAAEQAVKERPLWEIGVFTGAAYLPHYRGSDSYNSYLLPLPYIVYRGEVVRANRDGFNGLLWNTERFETAISFSGSPPVDDDNHAREGMPEIGAILELGPGAKFYLRDRDSEDRLYFRFGVRAACSLDTDELEVEYRGIRGGLQLIYLNRTLGKAQDLEFGINTGVDFADDNYNGYLYDVDPTYVTADREAYEAEGGYAGFSISGNVVKELTPRWSVAAYYRWDNISGAVYADSPLVETENNHVVGMAVICGLLESKRMSRYESE
ncbi:MAG: MipA/OmpV family protein [Verrucomicrobia bacterium]|jgi:MipA family protein|nr:MipA/OmpV family protein [Verrucomicrobiota bacterium]